MEEEITHAWDEDDTMTYREVAKEVNIPRTSLHRYATKELDFRMLGTTVRPMPSEANRAERMKQAKGVVALYAPLRARLGIV